MKTLESLIDQSESSVPKSLIFPVTHRQVFYPYFIIKHIHLNSNVHLHINIHLNPDLCLWLAANPQNNVSQKTSIISLVAQAA